MTTPPDQEAIKIARELRGLERAWRDGSLRALAKAIILVRGHDPFLPDWLLQAVLALIAARGQEFRSGNQTYSEWELQNAVHYKRWLEVSELRDRKQENPDDLLFKVVEPTWDAFYERASEQLKGTDAAGSPDAIKKSYQLVQRTFKSEGKGWRFVVDWWGCPLGKP